MSDEPKKVCRFCGKELKHSWFESFWKLVSLEGEIALGTYTYCISCGTLRKETDPELEDDEQNRTS